MPWLTSTERLWLPSFVLFLQAVMLVLFGVLVEYDEFGAPVTKPPSTNETSSENIQSFYPREYLCIYEVQ